MTKSRIFNRNTIAMIYDFDGTLSPQPMQEYTVLPKIGIQPKVFWKDVNQVARETLSEPMLVYMRLLIEKAEEKKIHIGKSDFADMAKEIKYFPGVESWFGRINNFVNSGAKIKINVEHYIISSGMKEILNGISIKNNFKQIYASEYYFNHHGMATFPKLLITGTSKTQFIFRINKGKQRISESINEYMPKEKRPIPFPNIIYIGDGTTDVPSMTVTKFNGGHTFAVYQKRSSKGAKVCRELLNEGRVHFIAPADYSKDSLLEKRVRLILKTVIADIECQKELFDCRKEHEI